MIGYLRGAYHAWLDYPLPAGYELQRRYRLLRSLGEGSYGLAYLAMDAASGSPVVLKQARPSKRELGRRLLIREQEALQVLGHPDLPACGALIEERRHLWLPIEWVDGATVEDLIFTQRRGFTELESLKFLERLLPVVAFIHERGWVHLDLRIPNVMDCAGRLKLIDFGLARRIGDMEGLEAPQNGEEERRRLPRVESDLYALGHFLLFLLYASYEGKPGQEERGWQEELDLSEATARLLNRLMGEDAVYPSAAALAGDVGQAVAALSSQPGR
ncbi:protein kinase family protein [Paenibacillus filicis]|uniref:non-specific serine/threonine protein kinase n=1 Tax=Paenibacillus filicis TaxID=669464 RepID=A0ABU9DTY9_9BACL